MKLLEYIPFIHIEDKTKPIKYKVEFWTDDVEEMEKQLFNHGVTDKYRISEYKVKSQ